jgi:hypothetical protein
MRTFLVATLMAFILSVTVSAPVQAVRHSHRESGVMTLSEYNTIQIGWSKSEIQTYSGVNGTRTETWSDNGESWIQKEYTGGDGAIVFIDYRYENSLWINHYMTWCPGWDGAVLVCNRVKTDLT